MTLTEQGGRLFVSVARRSWPGRPEPEQPVARCGIDLGIGAEWAVIAHGDESVERLAHPAPWPPCAPAPPGGPSGSRRTVGSRAYRQANAKLAALDRRATNLRTDLHTLTSRLARRYGTVVVEDLDVAAMARGMGRRAFRRTVYRPASAGSGRCWATSAPGGRRAAVVADRLYRRRRPTTAAAVTWPTCSSVSGCGVAPPVDGWWTATPTRPGISVTGPDRSSTGMSSGVQLPPGCRSWGGHGGQAPAAGVGVRGPVRPPQGGGGQRHQNQPRSWGRGTPSWGTSQRAPTNAH